MTVMRRIKLTLEFDGTHFKGWQWQPTGERTVQASVQEALAKLPGQHSLVFAAGRTDAGVHALGMVAHFDTDANIPDGKFRLALNAHLPADVAVLNLTTVPGNFESRYSCKWRRYLYRIRLVRDVPRGAALDRHRVLPVNHILDIAQMQAAAAALVGERDFRAFATQETRTTLRTVLLSELREERGELRYHIVADGFLRNMIRTVIGTLLWVGRGKLQADDIERLILSRNRSLAGPNVAPHGLYFVEAGFEAFDAARSEENLSRNVLF